MRTAILSARIFAALFIMGVVTGCGTSAFNARTGIEGDRTQVEASSPKPPKWVVREPKSDAEFHYFRGFRSDAPSLEGGETDARHNAMATIVQFLGLRVTVDYRRMRTEEKNRHHRCDSL
jgi:hypothetical protein